MDLITNFNNFANNYLDWILDNNIINLLIIIFLGFYPENLRFNISNNLKQTCRHPFIIYFLIIYMLYNETNNIILSTIPSTLFILLYCNFFIMNRKF